ncbi:hypothetical protein SETIT_5G077700v2 [Setaria italica]|uniref:Secreted protein n=1 Tax=Setaria italica TaxID=4555 RepID=A0A368R2B8_SETIT|nr:hypothetical protein SETIT_5G077700v2 [Setaria italica]
MHPQIYRPAAEMILAALPMIVLLTTHVELVVAGSRQPPPPPSPHPHPPFRPGKPPSAPPHQPTRSFNPPTTAFSNLTLAHRGPVPPI